MASIPGQWRVFASLAFAAALIGGAYFAAESVSNPRVAEASTETALLDAIATKDSTGDGVPDWEKPLYGIPLNATTTDYFHLGMTDGEAIAKGLIVPIAATPSPATSTPPGSITEGGVAAPAQGSLTDAFAQNFITLYAQAAGQNQGNLTDDQITNLATEAVSELDSSVSPSPDFKSASDLTVSGSGPAALASYAAAAQAVLAAHTVVLPESELSYLNDAVNGSTSALNNITEISDAYVNIATGLAAVPVPQEAAQADLEIINASARIGEIAADFARLNTDPLATMLALEQYTDAVQALFTGYNDLEQVFQTEKVTVPVGRPGANFLEAVADFTAPAQSATP